MIVTPQGERRFAEIGEGNMNFRGILDACEQTGVEWAPVEQDNCYGRDPFESLEISFRKLRQLGAKA
jgi:sugar phosphate isomerase/epimerase